MTTVEYIIEYSKKVIMAVIKNLKSLMHSLIEKINKELDDAVPLGIHEFFWINTNSNIVEQGEYIAAEMVDNILALYYICNNGDSNTLQIIDAYELSPEYADIITAKNITYTEGKEKTSFILYLKANEPMDYSCRYYVYNKQMKILEVCIPTHWIK